MEKTDTQAPHKEGEPKSQGFRIHIDKPELTFKALQNGVSGELGTHLLGDPLEKISVEALKEENGFNLTAEISFNFDASYHRRIDKNDLIKTIIGKYSEVKERGGNFIFQASDKTQLVIGPGSVGLNNIEISTGCVEDILSNKIQLFPEPKLENDEFNRVTTDFIEFLEKTVDEIYKGDKKTSPNEVMTLHPPPNVR